VGFSIRRFLLAALSQKEAGISQLDWKYLRFSYAQYGEDLIAEALLPQSQGFYVDVGAFHPVTLSNTYLFYRKGWNGIAVEANPEMARLFKKKRPRDIVVGCAVDEAEGTAAFDITDSGPTAHLRGSGVEAVKGEKPRRSVQVQRRRLDSILEEHLPKGRNIDFLSVDCEGHDLNVLRSNDWNKYRPRVLAVEDWETETESRICKLVFQAGYRLVIKTGVTRIFALTNSS
jgi:FkbM family methyltransferase